MGRLDPNLVVPGETPNREKARGRVDKSQRFEYFCIPLLRHVLLSCFTFWGRLKGRQGTRDKDEEQYCFSKGKCRRRDGVEAKLVQICSNLIASSSGARPGNMTPHPVPACF